MCNGGFTEGGAVCVMDGKGSAICALEDMGGAISVM